MNYTFEEVSQFIEEKDVKFIKLTFCDIFGNLKNISVLPCELNKAFESGLAFNASALSGLMHTAESDLVLFPDPSTLTVLPWRSAQSSVIRLFCKICYPDGTPFEGDGRRFLKSSVDALCDMGYKCYIGSNTEFYLFNMDESGADTKIPMDNAGYLDAAPLDKGENVRREICLTLEQMGINPECSHHEAGPGQSEIDFKDRNALKAADNLLTYKSVVSSVAAIYGLCANFDPKPLKDFMGNSLHINILLKEYSNTYTGSQKTADDSVIESFAAGVLNRIKEMTLFLNSKKESYDRIGKYEAPKYISWSKKNKAQLMRIPDYGEKYIELRSPDPACNPYFAFGLIIQAGIEGIKNKEKLPSPIDIRLTDKTASPGIDALPQSLEEAYELALKSDFVNKFIPRNIIDAYKQ